MSCPFMPVSPRKGQRSGFAAYQYEGGGPNTPENWAKLDCKNPPYDIFAGCSYCTNECGGRVQSPVDVKPAEATSLSWISGVKFEPSGTAMVKYDMASGSYKMSCMKLGTCGTVSVGNDRYDMLQLHTHQHSEHALNGKLYPTEVHVVHLRGKSELLVVGVFFEVGAENPDLQTVIDAASTLATNSSMNVAGLLGDSINPEYMTLYQGSLTTPPCSEGVRWAVSSKVRTASQKQINMLTMLAGGKTDARPVQPLHDRPFLKL